MDCLKANKYEVIWLNSFKDELSHMYNYFSINLNENGIAAKFHKKVINSLSHLSYYPELYQKINHSKEIRRIPIGKYVIFYTINRFKKQVFILHIFHGNQNYFNKL